MRAKEFLRERQVQQDSAVMSESFKIKSLNPADVEYIKSLRHLCAEPSIGNKYIPIMVALLASGPTLHGDTQPKILIKFDTKKIPHLYVLKNDEGKKYHCPDEHLSDVGYTATFLFDDNEAYNKFKSALLIKFDMVLPESLDL